MDYEVSVDVRIQSFNGPGGSLMVSERVMIKDCTFNDMADILRGFHELAQAVKIAKEGK